VKAKRRCAPLPICAAKPEKASRRHQSFCQSTFWPSLAHSSCAQIRATSSGMGLGGRRTISLHSGRVPFLPSPYPGPGNLHRATQVRKARDLRARRLQPTTSIRPARGSWRCVDLGFKHQSFCVHQQVTLRMPRTFFAPSIASLFSPPTPVVLADWESTISRRSIERPYPGGFAAAPEASR
jgi:hypothetical protein